MALTPTEKELMALTPTEKELRDFVLKLECDIIPRLKSAGFERNKYNVFNILRLNRQEIRHSAFLAFLMNPNQSGNVGSQFLRHFLILLEDELKLDPTDIFNYEFKKVIVRQEHEHIDLLADIQISNGEKILIVIENKIDSDELIGEKDNEGQLRDCRQAIEKEYNGKDYKTVFLFLSPNKREPKKDTEYWTPIDYGLIYDVLYRIDLDTADSTVITLINDYRKLIRSEFDMGNNELIQQQAIDLYAKYKDVFDFVFKCKPDRVNKTAEVMHEWINKLNDWIDPIIGKNRSTICFTTKNLKELWQGAFKIYFQIDMVDMDLVCYVEGADDKVRELLDYPKKSATFRYGGKQWLVDGNIRKTADMINDHMDYVLNNNIEPLRADIQTILVDWFTRPSGWIAKQSADICSRLRG